LELGADTPQITARQRKNPKLRKTL